MNSSTIKEAFAFGYKKTIEHLWFLMQVSFIVLFVTLLINSLQKMASESSMILGAFFFAFTFAIDLIIKIGYTKIYLGIYNGEEVHVGDVFYHHGKFFIYCVAYVILTILTLAGFLLFIIPGLYVVATYIFVPFLVIEKDMPTREAFKISFQMTRGHRGFILFFILLVFILNAIGLAAFILGLLFTMPMTYLALVYLYKKLLPASLNELPEAPEEAQN